MTLVEKTRIIQTFLDHPVGCTLIKLQRHSNLSYETTIAVLNWLIQEGNVRVGERDIQGTRRPFFTGEIDALNALQNSWYVGPHPNWSKWKQWLWRIRRR